MKDFPAGSLVSRVSSVGQVSTSQELLTIAFSRARRDSRCKTFPHFLFVVCVSWKRVCVTHTFTQKVSLECFITRKGIYRLNSHVCLFLKYTCLFLWESPRNKIQNLDDDPYECKKKQSLFVTFFHFVLLCVLASIFSSVRTYYVV